MQVEVTVCRISMCHCVTFPVFTACEVIPKFNDAKMEAMHESINDEGNQLIKMTP